MHGRDEKLSTSTWILDFRALRMNIEQGAECVL